MKYIVITSKHHDGFAMFHSKASKYNIYDATPFHRDPMRNWPTPASGTACDCASTTATPRIGTKADAVGNYWDFPKEKGRKDPKEGFDNYMERKALPQVREILTQYGPIGLIWYDTPIRITKEQSERFVALVNKLQPDCLVNSRVGFQPGRLRLRRRQQDSRRDSPGRLGDPRDDQRHVGLQEPMIATGSPSTT